jgi:hypothetical protein
MLGRTFKVLREFYLQKPRDIPENQSRYKGLQVELPACTTLNLYFDKWWNEFTVTKESHTVIVRASR